MGNVGVDVGYCDGDKVGSMLGLLVGFHVGVIDGGLEGDVGDKVVILNGIT